MHLTFEKKRFKQKFILMNQIWRQQSKSNVEKDFYKLMNNSNFGYDCRNNLDNCKFVPIFDEYKELTYIHRYHNIFDQKVSQFVTSELLRAILKKNLMINYQSYIKKIDFIKLNYKQLKQKDYNNYNWQKNLSYKRKKRKKEQN